MDIELKDIFNKKIIDIRDNYNFSKSHIPGSVNLEENKLILYPNLYLNKDEEYVIYCEHGYRSMKVSRYLRMNGYKVYNLIGGFTSYLKK